MPAYIQDALIDAFTDSTGVRKEESRSDKLKKTQSVSFRLDSNTLDELQREADLNHISLNVLVNRVLKRYSDWGDDTISQQEFVSLFFLVLVVKFCSWN
jgi:hypothetical protein